MPLVSLAPASRSLASVCHLLVACGLAISINCCVFCRQGIAPALVQKEFGEFLDLAESTPLDSKTCNIVLRMIECMSVSYKNTEDLDRGGEQERARVFRGLMLELMHHVLGPDQVTTIEPSSVHLVSTNP